MIALPPRRSASPALAALLTALPWLAASCGGQTQPSDGSMDRGDGAAGSLDGGGIDGGGPVSLPDASRGADGSTERGDGATTRHATLRTWRGFRHEWLRTVSGFRVPHRISLLISEARSDELTAGQSTGVDGNYMRPVERWGGLSSPSIAVFEGSHEVSWTDDSDRAEYPQARTSLRETIVVDLSAAAVDVEEAEMVLAGFSLDSTCEASLQPPDEPCNSDGMWPFRVAIWIEPCELTGHELSCPLAVDVFRAWTPNRGGLPPFEEKPFNHRLSFELTVRHAVIAGPADHFAATRGPRVELSAPARQDEPPTGRARVQGRAGMRLGTVAATGFGFTFVRSGTSDDTQHLGRYIGSLDFGWLDETYDPTDGAASFDHVTQVWIPDTVVATDADYELHTTLLQLDHPEARVLAPSSERGWICRNSSDEAPFFSRWQRCQPDDLGPEQTIDNLPLEPLTP